jgi:hypothetical protein
MILLMLAMALDAPAQRESPSLGSLLRNPRAEGRLTCRGEAVTDVVQAGEDYDGTSERDVVVVLGPGGEIWTSLGDDLICVYGASRADPRYGHGAHIVAGPGNDTVITYGGSNTILAGDGNDLIYLNGDIESVEAGEGNDHIWALGATVAYIYGEGGDDLIIGSPGNDGLYGEDGNDFILGAPGFDTIDGAVGYDTCYDTATGATFIDCEVLLPHPGLPESGGAIALGPARVPSASPRPAALTSRRVVPGRDERRAPFRSRSV